MEGNWVAKHAHKYNKHVVHRDKTKVRPRRRMTMGEIYDELEQETRDAVDSDDLSTKVDSRVDNS